MVGGEWLQVPVGRDASRWVTARTRCTVLAVVHTAASLVHLLDAVELLECDPRVQVVFTQAPDTMGNAVPELVRRLGGVVVPWHQAVHTDFSLALVTDAAGIHRLSAPVVFLPHGVMNNKLAPEALGGPGSGLVVGLSAPWLTWYGRLVPSALALSHTDLLEVLEEQCPQALPVATVVGDLCLDRLAASRSSRRRYRNALGVNDSRTLVAVSSTWGPESLFATSRALCDLATGPDRERYAVALVLHPAVWFGHGPRQIMAWLRDQRRRGLRLVDPLGWRGLAAAADVWIGDHGSATVYAAAAGVPVLRAAGAVDTVPPRSAVALLADLAPPVTPGRTLAEQVDALPARFPSGAHGAVAARITSAPGQAARLLRTRMYRLMRLTEPAAFPVTAPVPAARVVVDEE
jgi:hypothetical protein